MMRKERNKSTKSTSSNKHEWPEIEKKLKGIKVERGVISRCDGTSGPPLSDER